jgi:hypothetical protein
MAENPLDHSPETDDSRPVADDCDGCDRCRGTGRKFVMLRRSDAAAGASAETGLLGRTQEACLFCSGTGKAAS